MTGPEAEQDEQYDDYEEQSAENAKASGQGSEFFVSMQKLIEELKADKDNSLLNPLLKNRALSKDEYLDQLIKWRNVNPADFKSTIKSIAEASSGLSAMDIKNQVNARAAEKRNSKGKSGAEESLDAKIATEILEMCELRTIRESGTILRFEQGGWIEFTKLEIGEIAQKIGGRDEVTNKIIEEVCGKILRENLISMEDTERRPDLFMDGSGKVFSSITRQFEDVSNQKDVLVIHKISAIFNPTAPVPQEFLDALELIIPDKMDRDTFQEHVGSGYYRKMTYDKAVVLLGNTRNGKTTLFQIIEAVCGKNNMSTISLQDTAKPFRPYNMLRKLFNVMDDLNKDAVRNTSSFKVMTGGGRLTLEKKYGQPFDADIYAKSIFGCNLLPAAPDKSDDGYYSKFLLLHAPNTFLLPEQIGKDGLKDNEYEANPNLVSDLTSDPDKLSGILNWCLEGLARLNEQNGYSQKLTLEQNKIRYDAMSAPSGELQEFMKAVCNEAMITDMIYKMDMFEFYNIYCKSRKIPEPSMQEFNKRLLAVGHNPNHKIKVKEDTKICPIITKATEFPIVLKGLKFKDNWKEIKSSFEEAAKVQSSI